MGVGNNCCIWYFEKQIFRFNCKYLQAKFVSSLLFAVVTTLLYCSDEVHIWVLLSLLLVVISVSLVAYM